MAKTRLLQKILVAVITAYRYCISPLLGNHCRFTPSCSQYTQEAITQWGVMRGLGLACRRILRCHPWHPGGYDPVPKETRPVSSK